MRKYSFTTVQMPASTCARVPQKTMTIDMANRATVSFREARGARTLWMDHCGAGRPADSRGSQTALRASQTSSRVTVEGVATPRPGVMPVEVSVTLFPFAQTRAVEPNRADPLFEGRLLPCDELGVALHLEEPRAIFPQKHDGQNRLALAVGRVRTDQAGLVCRET